MKKISFLCWWDQIIPSTIIWHFLLHHIFFLWISERLFLSTAGPFGTVVSMLLTGFIASSWYGWPMVFYIFNGAGLVWCVLFAFMGANKPSEHTNITAEEKFYIDNSLGHDDHSQVSDLFKFIFQFCTYILRLKKKINILNLSMEL